METNSIQNKSEIYGKRIVQFSPIRSGSTLVYNILREIFPDFRIYKVHNCNYKYLKYPLVVTVRHPLDCIASSIQRYELNLTDEILKQQIYELNTNGIWDVFKIRNIPNVLMLRYEDFFDNFEYIFESVEKFFGRVIPVEKKNIVKNRYRIDAVEKIIEKKKNFWEYDPITHWHGKHISKYKGRPFYYKQFFQYDQIEYLKMIYKNFLIEFNYF